MVFAKELKTAQPAPETAEPAVAESLAEMAIAMARKLPLPVQGTASLLVHLPTAGAPARKLTELALLTAR